MQLAWQECHTGCLQQKFELKSKSLLFCRRKIALQRRRRERSNRSQLEWKDFCVSKRAPGCIGKMSSSIFNLRTTTQKISDLST